MFILSRGGDFNKYKLKCEERQLHLALINLINCSVKDSGVVSNRSLPLQSAFKIPAITKVRKHIK